MPYFEEVRTSVVQLLQVLGPFSTEAISSSERSISAANDKSVDPVLDEVESSSTTTFNLSEGRTPCGTDERSSQTSEPTDIVPSNLRETQSQWEPTISSLGLPADAECAEQPKTHANDETVLERLLSLSFLQQFSFTISRDETTSTTVWNRCAGGGSSIVDEAIAVGLFFGTIATNESLPSFSHDVDLATPAKQKKTQEIRDQ